MHGRVYLLLQGCPKLCRVQQKVHVFAHSVFFYSSRNASKTAAAVSSIESSREGSRPFKYSACAGSAVFPAGFLKGNLLCQDMLPAYKHALSELTIQGKGRLWRCGRAASSKACDHEAATAAPDGLYRTDDRVATGDDSSRV